MKVAYELVNARRDKIAQMLQGHSYVPIQKVCSQFNISEATARRDLSYLESNQRLVRTYGGALVEYNQKFPSFLERQQVSLQGKKRMAKAALELIQPKSTCFFDAGTTVYAIASELKQKPVKDLKIITNSLPIAELLTSTQGIEVHLLAGQYLHRQGVIFGETTIKTLRFYTINDAFMSAEGFDSKGLWNSDATVVEFQRQVIRQSERRIFLLGAEKMEKRAPVFLSDWGKVNVLISDAVSSNLPVYSQSQFKGKIFSI